MGELVSPFLSCYQIWAYEMLHNSLPLVSIGQWLVSIIETCFFSPSRITVTVYEYSGLCAFGLQSAEFVSRAAREEGVPNDIPLPCEFRSQ
jgi:hypothetical protein